MVALEATNVQAQDGATVVPVAGATRRGFTLALALVAGLALSSARAQDKKGDAKPGTVVAQPGKAPEIKPGTRIQPSKPADGKTAKPGEASKPGANGGAAPAPAAPVAPLDVDEEGLVNLAAFSEPVQLSALVTMLADTLSLNISIKGEVPGSVVFNAPVKVPKAELLSLVNALLEQQNYTIVQGVAGFYNVVPTSEVTVNFGQERPSTRVISTPNIRPSALQNALQAQMGAQGLGGVSYLDDLGVIVMTGTQRRLEAVDALVRQILAEYSKQEYIRVELTHVAAPVARERALQLVSMSRGGGATPGQPGQPAAPSGPGGGLDNLGDRLTVDPQGNAVIFRGVAQEIEQVQKVLALIDKPSGLQPKRYEVGSSASQIADLARQRGLGDITTITSQTTRGGGAAPGIAPQPANPGGQRAGQPAAAGGPTMVVDEGRGTILYYATSDQHKLLDELIQELDIRAEEIVIRTYKVRYSDAEEVADLVLAVLQNQTPAASNPLLPGGGERRRRDTFSGSGTGTNSRTNDRTQTDRQSGSRTSRTSGAGGGGELSIDGENAFVVADAKNSQIIVKAAMKQQKDFERLIQKLDLRRPSVYIEATIVSVTWDDSMRLAFETQLMNAHGKGGLLQTNFGLSTTGTSSTITDPKIVSPALGGFTAALLRTDFVPIAITALQNEADARVLSKPQLLVDDNEEAEIVSLEQQPTTTSVITSSGTTGTNGFGGFVDAGTSLHVKPQISGGGYLRMDYEVELSSFKGQGSNNLPPPRIQNNINSSVTVPSDFTVVVGGLTVDTKTKTIIKVPLLGDIPVVGLLFQDRNTGDKKTTLYVFLTPRVVRDPADIRLLSQQPRIEAGIPDDGLVLEPSTIETVVPDSMKK